MGSGVKGGEQREERGVGALHRVGSSSSETCDDENVCPSIPVEVAGGCSAQVNDTRGGIKDSAQHWSDDKHLCKTHRRIPPCCCLRRRKECCPMHVQSRTRTEGG